MKNKYEINGDVVTIFIKCKDEELETIVDLCELEKLKKIDVNWYGNMHKRYMYVVARNNNILKGKPKHIKLHQIIMDFPPVEKGWVIDHINRNPLDNRKENLRVVTRTENARNCGVPADNTSGTKGVYYYKRDNKWVARISVEGKRKLVGTFQLKEDAIKARGDAELKYWKQIGDITHIFKVDKDNPRIEVEIEEVK